MLVFITDLSHKKWNRKSRTNHIKRHLPKINWINKLNIVIYTCNKKKVLSLTNSDSPRTCKTKLPSDVCFMPDIINSLPWTIIRCPSLFVVHYIAI